MISKLYYLCFFLLFFPTRFYVVIHFGLAIVLLVNLLVKGLKDRGQWKTYLSNHTGFMFLWFLWTVLSVFWSLDTLQWALQSMVVFTAMIHSIYLRKFWKNKRKLFFIFVLANVLHNLISWTQLVLLGNRVPKSLFYNQNFLATYLLFSLIFIIFYKTSHYELSSPMKYGLLLSNFLLILFANSRGITTITFFILFVIFYFKVNVKGIRKLLRVLLLLAVVIGTFALLFTDILTLFLTDSSTVVRLNLVQTGLTYLMEQPFIGLGAGSIVYLLDNYPLHYVNDLTVLHHWWIGLLVTHGLIFFIVYISRYVWNSYLMVKIDLGEENPGVQMAITFFLAMVIAVMIPDSLFHSLWFWTMMNIVWTEIEEVKENDADIQSSWVKKIDVRYYLGR